MGRSVNVKRDMISLFLGITAVNLLALLFTIALGYGVQNGKDWSTQHQLAGVVAAIVCCAVHCIVFTYFMATAKWIRHAVEVKHLDPAIAAPTRSFKAQAMPAALLAMLSVFAAAALGAATFSEYLSSSLAHHIGAWAALAINVIVAFVEGRAIARNGGVIDDILRKIEEQSGAAPLRTAAAGV